MISFLLKKSQRNLIWAIVMGGLSGVCGAALIAVINAVLVRRQSGGAMGELFLAFVVLFFLFPMTRFASEFLLLRLAQLSVYDLRIWLAERILSTPLRHLEKLGPHRLLAMLTDDILQITNGLIEIPNLIANAAMITACLIYLGWATPALLLLLLAFLLVGGGSYHLAVLFAMQRFRTAREQQDKLYEHLRGMTEGAKELKLHAQRQRSFLDLLKGTAMTQCQVSLSARTMFSLATNWGGALFFVVIGTLLFWPRFRSLSNPSMVNFILVLLYIRNPLQLIFNLLPHVGQGKVALDKVEQLGLDLPPEPAMEGAQPESRSWESLELIGVCHSYEREGEEKSFTLGPLDATFKPGELVLLIGGNGSGKTTFAKLFSGLYSPESGEVRLNGEVVTDECRERYRQHFSAVFSEFYLFESLLGIEGHDVDLRARHYLSELRLDHKVEVKDGVLSTTELSRGQRKRLALLTAYLEDRPLYVFDEWAADQDPEFKEIFYRHILPELKKSGKSVLIISHDDRYFGIADRILKLENGKLIEGLAAPSPASSRGGLQLSPIHPAR